MALAIGPAVTFPAPLSGSGPVPTPPVLVPGSAVPTASAGTPVLPWQPITGPALPGTLQAQSALPPSPGLGSIGGSGILTAIAGFFSNLFSTIGTFLKGLWSKLSGSTAPAQPLDAASAQLAKQYDLLPTMANIQQFLVESRGYKQAGTLGPGSPPSPAVAQIQQALKGWGYAVNPTGTWDQATSTALEAFKLHYGLHQNYQMADGSWGVSPYVDDRTLTFMRQLENGQTPIR